MARVEEELREKSEDAARAVRAAEDASTSNLALQQEVRVLTEKLHSESETVSTSCDVRLVASNSDPKHLSVTSFAVVVKSGERTARAVGE